MTNSGQDKEIPDKARILDQGWNVLVWLVLGLVLVVVVVLALWWQNITRLGDQTDNFYRRNVIARKVAADVHALSQRLEESRHIANPRRFDRQADVINAFVQQVMLESHRLQSDYMGVDANTGLLQQAGQLQVISRRLTEVLGADLQARREESRTFADIAADLQLLRQSLGKQTEIDDNRYRRLVRVINAAATSQQGGETVLLISRLLGGVLDSADRVIDRHVAAAQQPPLKERVRALRLRITLADTGEIARRRVDASQELSLLYQQAEKDFAAFNESFLGQLDVYDRNEIRDTRQSMTLILNLHLIISVLSALVAGYVLVSMLRNRMIEPLSRELVLLEQILPRQQQSFPDKAGGDMAESIEEDVLARARQHIAQEQVILSESAEEQKEAKDAARRAALMAGAAADAQNAFLASLSHQIRSPMNGVQGMLEVLGRGRLSQDQRDLVSVIGDCSDSLMRILDDVHDYSRLESGQLTLQSASFVLEDVVVGVAEAARGQCLERGLDLSVCVDAALPRSYVGDAMRLRQVLGHLLGCIVETTDRGSVSVNVSSLTPRISPVMLRFQVIGSGVPAEDVNRWRRGGANWVPSAAMTEENVPRLGLMISENIVSLMGGQVEPLSGSAHTSGFVFDIPLESLGLLQEEREQELNGLRIGIADPAIMSRQTLENYLTADNARLVVFDDYQALEENLRQFSQGGDPIDLLIISPAFESGEHMNDIINVVDSLEEDAPNILVLTRSEDQRLPAAFNRLHQRPLTLTQPVRRLSLFRTVAVAGGLLDDSVLRQMTSRKTRHWRAPARKDSEEAGAVILVAEDDSTARLVIGKQLEELGYVFDVVENGEEVLAALGARECYGMVLMDCFMPVVDGFATAVAIRESEAGATRHLPIAAMTASTESRQIKRCRESGMDAYLGKPVALDKLDECILTWLPVAGELRQQQELDAGLSRNDSMPAAE